MKKRNFFCLLIIGIFVLTNPSTVCAYQEETLGDYMEGIGTKLMRGLGHILTSPAEIPCTMKVESETENANYLTGFAKGTLWMLRRILVGASEIGTFIIPMERTLPPVCHEESPAV